MARRRNARLTTLHRAIPVVLGIVVATAALSIPASAQPVEIAPVGGYRFGGGFFEQVTQQQVDLDGAPVFGFVVNVPLHDGLFVEAFASHQQGSVTVPDSATAPATRWLRAAAGLCALGDSVCDHVSIDRGLRSEETVDTCHHSGDVALDRSASYEVEGFL